jgi:hypothetical protein
VRSAERALQLARKAGKQDAAKEITARLERYKSATLQQPGKAD